MSDPVQHQAAAPATPGTTRAPAIDTLGQMYRQRSVPETHVAAGRHFQLAARRAGMARPLASDPRSRMDAGRILTDALDVLGGARTPIGSVALDVLARGRSIEDWARTNGFAPGRPVAREVATGLLEGALAILAVHFGYAAEGRRASA
jgi:hypothetical protein